MLFSTSYILSIRPAQPDWQPFPESKNGKHTRISGVRTRLTADCRLQVLMGSKFKNIRTHSLLYRTGELELRRIAYLYACSSIQRSSGAKEKAAMGSLFAQNSSRVPFSGRRHTDSSKCQNVTKSPVKASQQ